MATKYLQYFPKPLLDDLVNGRWLPVVGAGFSRNAILPPGKQMPLWNELGDAFAADLRDYSATNALDAISAFDHSFGRPKLMERLSEALYISDSRPGPAHQAFCSLPFDIVCTTNFDFLLERQYETIPRTCTPLVEEAQLSINLREPGVALLKLHGDLRHPSRLIATEGDYDRFLGSYPMLATYLSNLLITRTAVLIGYSLDDPDFRQLWEVVGQRLGRSRRVAYVIAVGAKQSDVARFERRGVKVIALPLGRAKYGEVVATTFKELQTYWAEALIPSSQVKEEQSLRELSLPPDAQSRLCFVATPLSLLSFYRERVYPIIRNNGFVPVTADDVVAPGDTILPKIDALIGRALIMIVDASSEGTLTEFRLALRRMGQGRVLLISEFPEQLPSDITSYQTVIRPSVTSDQIDDFLEQIEGWLMEAAIQFRTSLLAEPARLLAAGEYRAAVISAISVLEARLRKELDLPQSSSGRPITLRDILELAHQQGLLGNLVPDVLKGWLTIRNAVVHRNAPVAKEKAEEIVGGIALALGY